MDENTIVKDSSGMVYPFAIWRSLTFTGDYSIRPVDPKNANTEFLLVRLTEQQKNNMMTKMPKPKESLYFKTGDNITLFKSSDINGKKINLKDAKEKIIVLNFWFINCPPCRMEIPELNKLVDAYKGNDSVLFISVALDQAWEIKDFLKQTPFNYTIIDDGKYLAGRYGIKLYPTHIVIGTDGKIYFHTSGLAANTVWWLNKTINELLHPALAAKN